MQYFPKAQKRCTLKTFHNFLKLCNKIRYPCVLHLLDKSGTHRGQAAWFAVKGEKVKVTWHMIEIFICMQPCILPLPFLTSEFGDSAFIYHKEKYYLAASNDC